MNATPSDKSITSRLAEAEMAHNTASAMLAASLVREREAQTLCATLQNQMPLWVAAATTRQSLDRWELPRILPVAVFPFPITVLGFIAAAELTGVIGMAAVIAMVLFLAACSGMVLLCLFPDDKTVARLRDRLPVAQQHLAASKQHREQMQGQVSLTSERLADARDAVSKAEHEIIRVRQEKEQRFEAVGVTSLL